MLRSSISSPGSLSLVRFIGLSAFLFFTQSLVGQLAKPLEAPFDKLPPGAKKRLALKDLEQFAVYWTDEPGWHTELQLRNNLVGQTLTVTPVLRSHDGAEAVLPDVTIQSGDVSSVDVHDVILQFAPQMVGNYGSVVFRYRTSVKRALYAAVMVHNAGHPISYHFDAFSRHDEYQVGSREGIWWLPNETANDYLILTNMGSHPVNALLELITADGKVNRQPVLIGPRQTNRLSVRELLAQAKITGSLGGLRISTGKGIGLLTTAHIVYDETVGFSAMMKMFDHDPEAKPFAHSWGNVKQWTTRAPMLALTNPDLALGFPGGTTLQPKVFLRNATHKSYEALVTMHWKSADSQGTAEPFKVLLKPEQTTIIDVADLQRKDVLPAEANWASVTISGPVMPEDFLAIAASYDETLRYGAQTPFNDQLAFHWEGGKWEVDSTHNSIMAIGNGGDKSVQAELTVLYDGGKSSYVLERPLAPGEQMWVDMATLIRNQVPGKDGKPLPVDLNSGTYRVRDLTDQAVGNLYEGKVVTDKKFGHAAYGCMICCGYPEGGFMNYDPFGIQFQMYGSQAVVAVNSCWGTTSFITGFYNSWWTGDTSVATASMNDLYGTGTGSTGDYASGVLNVGDDMHRDYCPTTVDQPVGALDVYPSVSISGPAGVAKGGTTGFEVAVGSNPNNVQITLSLSTTSGTGDATFNNNTHTHSLTASATVAVKGITQSSIVNNLSIQALDPLGNVLASRTFSVVWVSLSLRHGASAAVSSDNSARINYSGVFGHYDLNAFPNLADFGCKTGVEIVGTVTPSGYSGSVILKRQLLNFGAWDGTSLIGINNTSRDDTSNASWRDDEPQSGGSAGKVYDLDAPGSEQVDLNHTFRVRQNFSSYAVLNSADSSTPASDYMPWYSAVSCTLTQNGPAIETTVSNDNKAGTGSIPLSWNLQ